MRLLKDEPVRASACPYCNTVLDKTAGLVSDDDQTETQHPDPGDMTLCPVCAQILVFDDTLTLRRPKSGEIHNPCGIISDEIQVLQMLSSFARKVARRPLKKRVATATRQQKCPVSRASLHGGRRR